MKKQIIKIFLILLVPFFTSCKKKEKEATPKVIVSVPPYVYFVKKIAGTTVNVQTMIPPNSNPHLFEPTSHQTLLALQADIWFKIGESFERLLVDLMQENNPSLTISDLRQGIDLISYEHCFHSCSDNIDFKDVHIWTSPRLAKIQAKTIASILIEKYPKNKDIYASNLSSFLLELDQLNLDIEKKIFSIKGSAFLISHPAFAYFCKDYNLHQISIEYEGKDPTLKMLGETLNQAKEKNIKKVFIQAQYNNKGAEIIAKKIGAHLHLVDPYSINYEENLKNFVEMLISK